MPKIPTPLTLPPPRRKQVSATLTGHYLEGLEHIHKIYCTGDKLGEAIPPMIELAMRQLHNEIRDGRPANAPTPTPEPDNKTPIDWSKGDPLPDLAPNPHLQSLVDIFNEPLPLELPRRGTPITPVQEPPPITLLPKNLKMLIRTYFRDNYLHEMGTKRSQEVSASILKLLLAGHSVKPGSDFWGILERDMEKMKSYPDHIQRWFVPNPRWPEATALVYGPAPKYEV